MLHTLRRSFAYMAPYWGLQGLALLCALGAAAAEFVWPYVSKLMVDRVLWPQAGTDAQRLSAATLVATIAIGGAAAGALLGLVRSYLFARVGERAAADLRRDLMRHLHRQPMAFFDARKTGGVMSVVQNDVEALQGLYSSTLVETIRNLAMAVVAIAFMFRQSPRLALCSVPVPVVFAAALALFGQPLRRAGRRVREETGHVQEVLQESISGEREVKVFGRAASELGRFMERVDRLVRARIGMAVLGAANGSVANMVAVTGMTIVLLTGSRMAITRQMSAGDVVMFLGILGMLFGPASAFVNLFTQVAAAVGAADRVFEFLDAPEEAEKPAARSLGRVEGRVAFEGVSFRYDAAGPDILQAIDLEVAPGEMVALVGPSGSGKTTLVSLLPRLYDVAGGRVTVDGVDVRDVTLASLREAIGIVPQEPFLFGTTVAENIAFGRVGATRDDIVAAARAANAHEFVMALPDGYETMVGERGARLSVGQKQRVAIARAILRDPRILILDEATSAQDSESERLVQEAMRRLMQGRTSFVIAHRLSTVQKADRIVVLEGGRIVESGRHADLVAGAGLYARLHALQFTPEPVEAIVAG